MDYSVLDVSANCGFGIHRSISPYIFDNWHNFELHPLIKVLITTRHKKPVIGFKKTPWNRDEISLGSLKTKQTPKYLHWRNTKGYNVQECSIAPPTPWWVFLVRKEVSVYLWTF